MTERDDMKLMVEVKAELVWREPPKDDAERHLRAAANVHAAKVADELHEAATLLVALLLTRR